MKGTKWRVYLCGAILVVGVAQAKSGSLLVNGGFETVVSTTPPSQWPTDAGYWAGDGSAIVTASDGIIPYEGAHMLHLIWSGTGGQAASHVAAEVLQVASVSTYESLISAGLASAVLSARFNRVAGDSETDSMFGLRIYAFSGDTNTFFTQYESSQWLAETVSTIVTDGDTNTWEIGTATLLLPANTDFVAVNVFAWENVFNDLTGVEFDGHYADGATLVVTPEPATLVPEPVTLVCGLIGLGMIGGYLKKRRAA